MKAIFNVLMGGKKVTLTAVTEKQLAIWKEQKIVALPAVAIFYEWGLGEELLEKSKTYFEALPKV